MIAESARVKWARAARSATDFARSKAFVQQCRDDEHGDRSKIGFDHILGSSIGAVLITPGGRSFRIFTSVIKVNALDPERIGGAFDGASRLAVAFRARNVHSNQRDQANIPVENQEEGHNRRNNRQQGDDPGTASCRKCRKRHVFPYRRAPAGFEPKAAAQWWWGSCRRTTAGMRSGLGRWIGVPDDRRKCDFRYAEERREPHSQAVTILRNWSISPAVSSILR